MPRKLPLAKRIKTKIASLRLKTVAGLRKVTSRRSVANIMMLSFILLCAFGAGMIYPPAGFLTAGVCCGLYGFLLGSE